MPNDLLRFAKRVTSYMEQRRQIRTHIERRAGGRAQAGARPQTFDFPAGAEGLKNSGLYNQWWYYSVELLPGVVTNGIYPADVPMLPRLMLRRCVLDRMSCLDLGSMEGLIPALMCRAGAGQVVATDAIDHCAEKMEAVKHYYGVDFEFETVGLMYDLHEKLPGRAFDLINCSGVLYHVVSPLHVLFGLRPLLKRDGLLIVSTNVINNESYTMEFNDSGRLQEEGNTFWYPSVKLFDYILRYLKLAPIDCAYLPHSDIRSKVNYIFDKPSGYLSVVCRAVHEVRPTKDDKWMAKSKRSSWEYLGLCDWKRAGDQPGSAIKYRGEVKDDLWREDSRSLDLWRAINERPPVTSAERPEDSHLLRLSDRS